MAAFMKFLGSTKESLRKILVRGEYEEYPDDKEMHCTARLAKYLNDFSCKLMDEESFNSDDEDNEFLMEEIRVLEEGKGIGLPNFDPRAASLNIMQNKINQITLIPEDFACKVWYYVEKIVLCVIGQHSENYPQLAS